jgi:hypothetical protein
MEFRTALVLALLAALAAIVVTSSLAQAAGPQGADAPFADAGIVGTDGMLLPNGVFVAPPSPKWIDGFCDGNEQCLVGDFNGDGKDDIAALTRDTRPPDEQGDVWVALATGTSFAAPTKWNDFLCTGLSFCKVGDVNGDGRDDIVSFTKGSQGQVLVAISSGFGFASPAVWQPFFCVGNETCDVGDFNGDGRDDIILFFRSVYGGDLTGDVRVALSNGISGFDAPTTWHSYFCINQETCAVGDMNGDRRDDIVTFTRGSAPKVYVALSTGANSFGAGTEWYGFFCLNGEICGLADFTGDARSDAIAFLRDIYAPNKIGQVDVAASMGSSLRPASTWIINFCVNQSQDCSWGDFDGDRKDDIITFVKAGDPASVGDAFVALSGGVPAGFINTIAPWQDYFCVGGEQCASGDFNGDGRDDVAYFVRDFQSGGGVGNVYVALSNGDRFGVSQRWAELFCTGQEICLVADVNGDRRDDLVSFARSQYGADGDVYVALSTGFSFGPRSKWNEYFCIGSETCGVGDFNGDGYADIVLFKKSIYGGEAAGDVQVALSNGYNAFNFAGLWQSYFCIGNETCDVGDFNGDGKDDIAAFTRSATKPFVYVALSSGSQFGSATSPWSSFFCLGNEVCGVGDFNGDGKDDVITFLRSTYSPNKVGNVFVQLSNGANAFGPSQLWNPFFCVGNEWCGLGDYNGDGLTDISTFLRDTVQDTRKGDVFVALASPGNYWFNLKKHTHWVPLVSR